MYTYVDIYTFTYTHISIDLFESVYSYTYMHIVVLWLVHVTSGIAEL